MAVATGENDPTGPLYLRWYERSKARHVKAGASYEEAELAQLRLERRLKAASQGFVVREDRVDTNKFHRAQDCLDSYLNHLRTTTKRDGRRYSVTDGCPPLANHWGGYDLTKTNWLKKFAEEVADNNNGSFRAWKTLKEKQCDTSSIIELLYLVTLRGKYGVEQAQDSYHSFTIELEKIIQTYDRLRYRLRDLLQNPLFSAPMSYVRRNLAEELQRLEVSKQRLEALRDSNRKWGSYKRNAREWYLLLLAREVVNATGQFHVPRKQPKLLRDTPGNFNDSP